MSWKNPRNTWRKTITDLVISEISVVIVFILGCLMWKYLPTFHFEGFLQVVAMWIIIMPIGTAIFVINDRYHPTEEEDLEIRRKQYEKLRKEFERRCN